MEKMLKKKRPVSEVELEELEKSLSRSHDFQKVHYSNRQTGLCFSFTYYKTLTDQKMITKSLLPQLLQGNFNKIDNLKRLLPSASIQICEDLSNAEYLLLNGYVMITTETENNKAAFMAAKCSYVRELTHPEVEQTVIGAKEAFVESLQNNLNLIRKRLPTSELIIEEYFIGSISRTVVAVLYIEGITNADYVSKVKERIDNIDFDEITDSSYIAQFISDNKNSPFPQVLDTERPDRAAAVLAEGKVVIAVDGSPHVLITPTTFSEFFSSFEDYFINWTIASFARILRAFSVIFSIQITSIYVATLTYHMELIPTDLLGTLVTSRQHIPLPPFYEALILELVIELLREAGARLPTKVGQTIGIVGGIVIGTASVQAGLTSNVLLIIIALAALASFTTPVYKMNNSIRFLRFPFLFFATLWGFVGVLFCSCILLTHMIRLTSLDRPFLEPFYPPRYRDLKDSFIRFPFQPLRPVYFRTQNPHRFQPQKKSKVKKDIDE
ncbi:MULTISPECIES: spore germination protein [unclassified Cytobacillus]|uniref:spore germination protein n=1 Tax=unclassified Cytobacillus TaxID=2675268 RepID=UPI00203F03DB|nr:spore germination protein [Cytobacillus sp. AMY 15.2]MCM3091586.1 spore germination protein [Cytobacillus sp. AMY 15.2]